MSPNVEPQVRYCCWLLRRIHSYRIRGLANTRIPEYECRPLVNYARTEILRKPPIVYLTGNLSDWDYVCVFNPDMLINLAFLGRQRRSNDQLEGKNSVNGMWEKGDSDRVE